MDLIRQTILQMGWWLLPTALLALATLGFLGAPLFLWTLFVAAALFVWNVNSVVWGIFLALALVFNIPALRRLLVTLPILKMVQKLHILPSISETERVALDAGNVWVEAELFSGKPNFDRLQKEKYPTLTPEEKAFLDGPVEEICAAADDWKIWKQKDLTPELWELLKKHRLFGMIIPKEYDGLGFSALAHGEVVAKFASRCLPLCITTMVPNSLGPAELLIHYGTKEQKDYYLPRLARGEEIPCFALTEPNAGSDAGSITSEGTVFRGEDGKLYLRLQWNKRYITLSAVATVLGLAFQLKDPQNLLGTGKTGITCALIPTNTPGVVVGRRHDPLGVPFNNAPTQGKDVVVSLDCIVGGPEGAGRGWKMLMECLAAGRGISLPSQSVGCAKVAYLVTSAYAAIRKQFGISIGKFEGIMESLAKVGGFNYLIEATTKYTLGALDRGIKPTVVTAMAKYSITEIGRKVINHAMDIVGGAGISKGPKNLLAHIYISSPIAITVEGANILTRTLIIFGQGALRAHPYAYKEVVTAEKNDLVGFDQVLWFHVGHVVRNTCRSLLLSVTRGRVAFVGGPSETRRYYQKLAWASASFALLADITMGALGGKLKIKEKVTGRFADIISHMYLITAGLKRYEADGRKKEDLPFLAWSMEYCFREIQNAFDGILKNFEIMGLSFLFRGPMLWWSRINPFSTGPSDVLENKVAALMQTAGEQRKRMTQNTYIPAAQDQQMAKLENTFNMIQACEAIENKMKNAIRKKTLPKLPTKLLFQQAIEKDVITNEEAKILEKLEVARDEIVQVDSFTLEEYKSNP